MGAGGNDGHPALVGQELDHVHGSALLARTAREEVLKFVHDQHPRIGVRQQTERGMFELIESSRRPDIAAQCAHDFTIETAYDGYRRHFAWR
jgi:hypothetical protein